MTIRRETELAIQRWHHFRLLDVDNTKAGLESGSGTTTTDGKLFIGYRFYRIIANMLCRPKNSLEQATVDMLEAMAKEYDNAKG